MRVKPFSDYENEHLKLVAQFGTDDDFLGYIEELRLKYNLSDKIIDYLFDITDEIRNPRVFG
jgi:hypothetical protein